MLKIYIARHGQNEDNAEGILNGHRDRPLTELGEVQARQVADEIRSAKMSFNIIYTSPLIRASRTAEIIAETINGSQPQVEPLLIERDFGIMTGLPASRIEELCSPEIIKTDTITYFLKPEGAETFPDLLARAGKLLKKIRLQHDNGSVLLVSHGDFGKMIYAAYYALSWKHVLTQFHFGNSELILLSEDSSADEAHVFEIEQYNH